MTVFFQFPDRQRPMRDLPAHLASGVKRMMMNASMLLIDLNTGSDETRTSRVSPREGSALVHNTWSVDKIKVMSN